MARKKKRKQRKKKEKKMVVNTKGNFAPRVGGLRVLADFPAVKAKLGAAPDWVAGPCARCCSSEDVENANFRIQTDALDLIDPYGKDWELVRYYTDFPGVAWMDLVFARPSTPSVLILGQLRDALATSSVLDDTFLDSVA